MILTFRITFWASGLCKRLPLTSLEHVGKPLCQCLPLVCWICILLLGFLFSLPLNALAHSSYILLQHSLLSWFTHWDPQLGCTVHVTIVVGKILSAGMSTAVNQCKLSALLNTSKSLGFVPLGIVQNSTVLQKCRAICLLPRTLIHMCPTLDYVILRLLPLPGPRSCVPFISYLTGTWMSMLTGLIHPGYEN